MKQVYVIVGDKLVDITQPPCVGPTPAPPGIPQVVFDEIDKREEWWRKCFVPRDMR
jgi:hypothetical protein